MAKSPHVRAAVRIDSGLSDERHDALLRETVGSIGSMDAASRIRVVEYATNLFLGAGLVVASARVEQDAIVGHH